VQLTLPVPLAASGTVGVQAAVGIRAVGAVDRDVADIAVGEAVVEVGAAAAVVAGAEVAKWKRY
jgi:hypothetical protein